jgi:hypothetical protein
MSGLAVLPGRPGLLALVLLALLLPTAAAAQGLGDAAAKEREKREATPATAPAKVFTNDDLPESREAEAEEGESTEGDDETPELSLIGEADPLRAELDRQREERAAQERDWRARFTAARARVVEEEARCWHEVVRTQYYNGIPVQMKVQEFIESEAFRRAKQDLADLEEEFRRTGLPPGWARE